MKKLLTIISSSLVVTAPILTVTSCRLFSNYKIPKDPNHTQNPDYDDPIDNGNNNSEKVTSFEYEDVKYTIFEEDTANPSNVYYANQVLVDEANEFKSLIPNADDYKIEDLAGLELFPTIALLSQYIRSLEHFNVDEPIKSHFMFKDKDYKTYINSTTHHKLVKQVLDIVNQQKELKAMINDTNVKFSISSKRDFSIDSVRRQLGLPEDPERDDSKLWGISSKKLNDDGSWTGRYNWEEIPFHKNNKLNNRLYNFGEKELTIVPTGLWYYNRIVDFNGNFDNDLFLSKEFFEKNTDKYDPNKMRLVGDYFDQILRNKIKVYAMQKSQLDLLLAFLELQQALTDGRLISDENKTLKEQFKSSGITTKIDNFQDKVLEYLKVKQLVGFTLSDDMSNDVSLQLFPGTSFYENYETDFRATYRFAWNQYHKVVQPLISGIKSYDIAENDFETKFKKHTNEHSKHYKFIWANINHVDKLDAPHVITKQLAETRFNNFVNYYKNQFNWKFIKIDE
ncbi:MAG3960 family lipoprotein [Mycoplasma yeatsii]|uniref:MAG3960 family lipoprotein n=1 Tax=Mycoplasma yeatsii TaxID=51365 RepID=UPI0005B2447A|nr:hypothetical protein [Mycoplasma yeatsii]AJM71556.1 lipoprotein [Mycoplasma yeatsii GM274B]